MQKILGAGSLQGAGPLENILIGPSGSISRAKTPEPNSWSDVANRFLHQIDSLPKHGAPNPAQLSEMLRLQLDVSRYHLRVEMLSKVADSAVACLRKLSQSQ